MICGISSLGFSVGYTPEPKFGILQMGMSLLGWAPQSGRFPLCFPFKPPNKGYQQRHTQMDPVLGVFFQGHQKDTAHF